MGTFETYQRQAVELSGVTEPAQRALALADLRALETEISSAGLNDSERRSLLFTLSSVMINLASDAGSADDVKSGVEWATRLLDDDGSPAVLILQAAYNRANGLAEMFGIEEAAGRQPRVPSSSPAYRLEHLDGLPQLRKLHSPGGSDPPTPQRNLRPAVSPPPRLT